MASWKQQPHSIECTSKNAANAKDDSARAAIRKVWTHAEAPDQVAAIIRSISAWAKTDRIQLIAWAASVDSLPPDASQAVEREQARQTSIARARKSDRGQGL